MQGIEKKDATKTVLIADRYEQYDLIGAGGLANIYYGLDKIENRRIAIKRLTRPATKAYHDEKLGAEEARLINLCKHPNIVELYDSGEDEIGVYHIFELINGQGMDQALFHAPLIQADFIEVARQILLGLHAIHHQKILHCDIKPENIMLTRGDGGRLQVKIIDFGLATLVHKTMSLAELGKKEILGTPEFVSPELLLGERPTYSSDIYSTGHVLFFSLTGESAFASEDMKEIIHAHLEKRPNRLRDLRHDLDPRICDLVHSMIQKRPEDRNNDIEDLLNKLVDFI